MAKLNLAPIGSFSQIAVTTINNNMDLIEAAMEKTLTRDGETPNQLTSDLDMNHNDVLNVRTIDADDVTVNDVPLDDYIEDKLNIAIINQDVVAVLDEDNMSSDSANAVPTQQSVKAYVDTLRADTSAFGTDKHYLVDSLSSIASVDLSSYNNVRASRYTTGAPTQDIFLEKVASSLDFLGENITISGTMSSAGIWTLGTDISITGGKMVAVASGAEREALYGAGIVNQFTPLVEGAEYEVTYTVSGYSAGSVKIRFGTGGSALDGVARTGNGTYTERLVAPSGADIRLVFSAAAALEVDNLTVSRVWSSGFEDVAGNNFRIVAQTVTPQMFGAAGDGVTDDTDALRRADASACNFNVTLTGFGTYLVSSQVQLTAKFVDMRAAVIKVANAFVGMSAVIVRAGPTVLSRRGFFHLFFDGNRSNQSARGRSGPACFEIMANSVASAEYHIAGQNACVGVKVSSSSEHKNITAQFETSDTVVWWTQFSSGSTGDTTPDVGFLTLTAHTAREFLYMEAPASTHGGSLHVIMNVEDQEANDDTTYSPCVSLLAAASSVTLSGKIRGAAGPGVYIDQKFVSSGISTYTAAVTLDDLFVMNGATQTTPVVHVKSIARLMGSVSVYQVGDQKGVYIEEVTYSMSLKVDVSRLNVATSIGVELSDGSKDIQSGFIDINVSAVLDSSAVPLIINDGNTYGLSEMLTVRFTTDGSDTAASKIKDDTISIEAYCGGGLEWNNAEMTVNTIPRKDYSTFVFGDTLADDTMITFTPPRARGFIKVTDRSSSASNYLLAAYWAGATPAITSIAGSTTSEVSTTKIVTVSSDATDAKFKVTSTSDGFIQIANRLGGSRSFDVELS